MSSIRIRPENLGKELTKILDDYKESVSSKVKTAVDNAGKKAVKELKETSPKRAEGSRGYNKSWRKRATKETADEKEITVYSIQPGLPHLLEHGHANRAGGRTRAIPHIAPVEERVGADLEKEIIRSIEDG